MKTRCVWVLSLLILPWLFLNGQQAQDSGKKIGRLLVNIEAGAKFSPAEFARETHAELVEADERNPHIAFNDIFMQTPFAVLSVPVTSSQLFFLSWRYGYRYLSFNGESLDDAVTQANQLLAMIPKTSSEIPAMSKKDTAAIYDLMRKADQVFTENNLTYWATSGTLLGAIRHQGLIPWDDDLDICILDRDEGKLKGLKEALNNAGLDLYYYTKMWIYKITPLDGLPIKNEEEPGTFMPFTFPYLDVFIVALEPGSEYKDVYVHKAAGFYKNFNKERFRYSQIEAIRRVPFGPLSIPIPGDPEDFLNANYGTSSYPGLWRKYAIEKVWNHKLDTCVIGGTAMVELTDI